MFCFLSLMRHEWKSEEDKMILESIEVEGLSLHFFLYFLIIFYFFNKHFIMLACKL